MLHHSLRSSNGLLEEFINVMHSNLFTIHFRTNNTSYTFILTIKLLFWPVVKRYFAIQENINFRV